MNKIGKNLGGAAILIVALFVFYKIGQIAALKKCAQTVNIYRNTVESAMNGKVVKLMNAIDQLYVDSIDMDTLAESVLPEIMAHLDPHSAYYPVEETQQSNDELHGSFSGIGIQFTIREDTIHVNNVIHGGPSEKVGIFAGDRIVTIDDSVYVGKKINSDKAVKMLKGPTGSHVVVGIKRAECDSLISFDIERGPIPVRSVDAAYMMENNIGYIRLTLFGETTYSEMMSKISELKAQGCEKLVIDLRDNVGGYLGAAIQICNEFLAKGRTIVYTEGVHSPKEIQKADGRGHFKNLPIVILINEGTASASEIFSGAMQDNDRAFIVGRRSFGKGLVQQSIDFSDGSSIRLTIARYHTPSGRCIQKPYENGELEYEKDILYRYERGEFFKEDSIKLDTSAVYKTVSGRTVYGGGGIMPDFFVAQDTIPYNEYYSRIVRASLTNDFAFKYVDKNRTKLSEFKSTDALVFYLKENNILDKFTEFAEQKDVKRGKSNIPQEIDNQIERLVLANIIYDVLEMDNYAEFVNREDNTVLKAVEILSAE